MSQFWRQIFPAFGERTLIMGILNVTPDSFSDGGEYLNGEAAIAHGRALIAAGADVIDIGGESSRPGAIGISAAVEQSRVLPIIGALSADVPVSIDTTKAEVAAAAIAAGACTVNDISGGTFDPKMREVVADHEVGYILMHTRDRPARMQTGKWSYEGGVVAGVLAALETLASAALEAGIPKQRLMLDPGFGFGKTVSENCQLLGELSRFVGTAYPVLVGTSKKAFWVS